jgi:hypothetical protein
MQTHNIPDVENIPVEVHRTGLGWFPDEPAATVHTTRTTHAPYVRSRIKRFLAAGYSVTGGFSGTEYVSAALDLSVNLPDWGPWTFTDVELNMLHRVLRWCMVHDTDLPVNIAMREAIFTAHRVRHAH